MWKRESSVQQLWGLIIEGDEGITTLNDHPRDQHHLVLTPEVPTFRPSDRVALIVALPLILTSLRIISS